MRRKAALRPLVRALAPYLGAQLVVLALVVCLPQLAHLAQPRGADAPAIDSRLNEEDARKRFNDMLKIPAPE